MNYYSESIEMVLENTKSRRNGLTCDEAEERLKQNGKNKLAEGKKESVIKRFFKQMTDPMIIILIAAAVVSAVTSVMQNESIADVFIILFVVIVNAVLGVYQESKAEKAIEALQKMSASTSKVIRNGNTVTVKSEDLVVGDIVLIEAGDSIPADGRLIESASLKIEEAALTGESVPVNKFIDIINLQDKKEVPLGDRKNSVYMGSTAVYGRGVFVVTATGMNTEVGKIADALASAEEGKTPLQQKLSQLSVILTRIVLAICVGIFAVQILNSGFTFESVLSSFMIAVSLAVAAIPEGLAAVVTVVLSIGVTNMSKRNAIIRKLTAVETLGCAQIICSDKTGTLTQNKMTVTDFYGENKEELVRAMALCSDAETDLEGNTVGEPTETALVEFAFKEGFNKNTLKEEYPRVGEAPFDSMRKMMSTVHSYKDGYIQFTKGAPDEILAKCTSYMTKTGKVPMTDEIRSAILNKNKSMADRALRVLAAGEKNYTVLPDSFDGEKIESELCFLGLEGMIDPVRPEVKDAINECRNAGINVVMITGDHIDTASAIAKELGILEGNKRAVTGSEIGLMSDEEFEKVFKDISVYARVQPEHKTRIVNAWRKSGAVTAMTGDGVNDAPSIKSADIGIGMGITGTDVTKNVADMVLADDNFATIVGAVEEGRRIYDNIRKAIQFLLGSNMSEVLSIFIATLMGFTILKPVHLLWINLVTDCFPALALGTEKAEKGIMERKPRNTKSGIFSDGMGFDVAYQGIMISLLTVASYFIGHFMESGVWEITDSPDGMTMAFLTMSMAEIFHCFNMRSQKGSVFGIKHHNIMLTVAAVGSLIATTLVCEVPFLASLFGFTSIEIGEYLVAIGLSVLTVPIVECVKFIKRKVNS